MKMLEVKYRCQHPSCVVHCREGVITLDEETFGKLNAYYEDKSLIKSPRDACRMGFAQKFKVLSIEERVEDAAEAQAPAFDLSDKTDDPIGILMAEHKTVLKVLDAIEDQMRKRDIAALWVSTAELENAVALHSIRKEEDVLFPVLGELLPLGEGLVAIVREDHRELVTLMHSFRSGLADGEIMDGLGLSILVNLRSHIRKEDNEFFSLVDQCLDDKARGELLEGFKKVESEFVPIKADEESRERARQSALVKGREKFDEEVFAAKEAARDSAGGCCH